MAAPLKRFVMTADVLSSPAPLVLPVDAEHGGIRAAGCATLFAMTLFSFFVLSLLLPHAALVNVLLALMMGAGAAYGTDRTLKGRWQSGRILTADARTIQLTQNQRQEMHIAAGQQVNVLPWRFTVSRNGRVKKGWYVVALGLEQEDLLLPVYTFLPPEEFEKLPLADQFTLLVREDKNEAAMTGSAREMKAAGQQRRLREAEKMRSVMGAEVTPEQFTAYIAYLQAHYPHWMPQS